MPFYEYECEDCGHRFEKQFAISQSKPSLNCPKCGKTAKKRLGTPGLKFVGPGFYETDYKRKSEDKEHCDTQ